VIWLKYKYSHVRILSSYRFNPNTRIISILKLVIYSNDEIKKNIRNTINSALFRQVVSLHTSINSDFNRV